MTYLCVAIYVNSLEQARRDALAAAEAGADLIELRIDAFTQPGHVWGLVHACPLPCILTCRSAGEGGQAALSDEERLDLLSGTAASEARYVDVELDTLRSNFNRAHELGRNLIASFHDFQ